MAIGVACLAAFIHQADKGVYIWFTYPLTLPGNEDAQQQWATFASEFGRPLLMVRPIPHLWKRGKPILRTLLLGRVSSAALVYTLKEKMREL
jgi:hypothetical protein